MPMLQIRADYLIEFTQEFQNLCEDNVLTEYDQRYIRERFERVMFASTNFEQVISDPIEHDSQYLWKPEMELPAIPNCTR